MDELRSLIRGLKSFSEMLLSSTEKALFREPVVFYEGSEVLIYNLSSCMKGQMSLIWELSPLYRTRGPLWIY